MNKNTITLSFADKRMADYVRLVCTRKSMTLENYIIDNFDWDDMPECISDSGISKKLTSRMCSECEERNSCPDAKVKV